jgi:3-polyprenyl-4-hydroxybenzoate decarboxylase
MAIAIDEDVDIYDSRDVMWAIATRVDPENIILAPPRPEVFQGVYPARRGIGLDATTPFDKKGLFERAKYPTSIVDLEKWISKDKIEEAGKLQSEYAKMLAKTGH